LKQGKIYVTVDKTNGKNDLLQICEIINAKYSEFSNVVICIYSNSEIGKEIALGKNEMFNKEDHQGVWLAMYTYNSVEGAYFDDNPSGYVGTF
jgi:hypothetical protein